MNLDKQRGLAVGLCLGLAYWSDQLPERFVVGAMCLVAGYFLRVQVESLRN